MLVVFYYGFALFAPCLEPSTYYTIAGSIYA